ncbi:class I SAM-dependent methyltransferase [Nocardia asteroides]|uniref:class I SAM-dependent methyltransferase n=1 Tax=Nocardia asteroides TaxID=1824 RepID=UPI0037C58E57
MTETDSLSNTPALTAFYNTYVRLCEAAFGTGVMHRGFFSGPDDPCDYSEGADRLTRHLAGYLALSADQHLLDVGCGAGQPTLLIGEAYDCRVTGIAMGTQEVELARKRAARHGLSERSTFLTATATDLPFENESFDSAIMLESLLHIEEKTLSLSEIKRTLKSGGTLVISDFYSLRPELQEKNQGSELQSFLPNPFPITLEELQRTVAAAGMTVSLVFDLTDQCRWSLHKMLSTIKERSDTLSELFGPEVVEESCTVVESMITSVEGNLGYGGVVATRF